MSDRSLEEMLSELERNAAAAQDYKSGSYDWPRGEMLSMPPFWAQRFYLAYVNPAVMLELIAAVRSRLSVQGELPEADRFYGKWETGCFPIYGPPRHNDGPFVLASTYDAALAEIGRLKGERDRMEDELDTCKQLDSATLPCGHLSRYGFTDDGGKTGYCTLCALSASRADALKAVQSLRKANHDHQVKRDFIHVSDAQHAKVLDLAEQAILARMEKAS